MRRIRILRVLCFAAIYFSIHLTFMILFTLRTYSGTPELTWYLQHPMETLRTIIFELSHKPLLIIPLVLMTAYTLTLGFVTDLILTHLKNKLSKKPENPQPSLRNSITSRHNTPNTRHLHKTLHIWSQIFGKPIFFLLREIERTAKRSRISSK